MVTINEKKLKNIKNGDTLYMVHQNVEDVYVIDEVVVDRTRTYQDETYDDDTHKLLSVEIVPVVEFSLGDVKFQFSFRKYNEDKTSIMASPIYGQPRNHITHSDSFHVFTTNDEAKRYVITMLQTSIQETTKYRDKIQQKINKLNNNLNLFIITETIKLIQEVENNDSQDEWIDNEKIFNKEFINYLAEKAIGDISYIIEDVNNTSQRMFLGYINVTKILDKDNRILLKYVYNDDVSTAKWIDDSNYAISYNSYSESGYMLLPTNQYNVYFLMFYKE